MGYENVFLMGYNGKYIYIYIIINNGTMEFYDFPNSWDMLG
jgi:hypothetical protein